MHACTTIETPIGPLGLVASERALLSVRFHAQPPAAGHSAVLDDARRQLEDYFAGESTAFDLPLELHGTDFQRACWLALSSIPYGQPLRRIQQRLLWVAAGGWQLDIRVYLGTERPGKALLARAQAELDRLTLPTR